MSGILALCPEFVTASPVELFWNGAPAKCIQLLLLLALNLQGLPTKASTCAEGRLMIKSWYKILLLKYIFQEQITKPFQRRALNVSAGSVMLPPYLFMDAK